MTSPLNMRLRSLVTALLLTATSQADCTEAQASARAPLKVYQLQPEWLAETKAQITAGDSLRQHALQALLNMAEQTLRGPDYSIVNKAKTPPSGNKHDYMSVGPYWWPDPESADGLPWVRRDGQVNPTTRGAASDSHTMGKMQEAVTTLALAYYFTAEEKYAARATELLQVFFLNDATRMNPNLNFGQGIPGRTTGRDIGIIESRKLMAVVDAIGILETSEALPPKTRRAIQVWFAEFLHWLRTSENGKNERAQHNNHGTFYDAQVAHFALFTGDTHLAIATLQAARRRIDAQIDVRGEQAHELARTRPFHYSAFNLKAFFALAQIGTHLNLDLWQYQASSMGRLQAALDYLNHYKEHPVKRDGLVETQLNWGKLQSLNQIAAMVYDPDYSNKSLDILQRGEGNLQCLLLFPVPDTKQLEPLTDTLINQEANGLCSY
jgi:hypothetical protein